jgi:ubiquinone/menaquinone biosynthesis C-methylase UbiE
MSDPVIMGGRERRLMATRAYRVMARLVAPWALQGTHPHGDVLEIGAGVGAMAHHLLSVTPDIRMIVTDVDADMCSIASRNLRRFGTTVIVQQADANDLPFGDGSLEYVLSFLMLHHTGDWRQTVQDAVRVLRPGGRFVGFDIEAGGPLHHPERFEVLIRRGELDRFLPTLPVTDVRIRSGLARMVVRFVATKKAD